MSRRNLLFCGALVWMAAASQDRFVVRVSPGQSFPRGAVRVVCTIPLDDRNRGAVATLGVEAWTSDERPVEGVVTHQAWFFDPPCEAGDAFCAVSRVDGHVSKVTAPFRVVSCGDSARDRH